ncbi:UPF0158 family protein [Candidatus Similichlamydia laticola]|uniref:Uncharacterized protein n=1 Tax=Candidatus Similichlamydia laticola TaxID=2170265 RepID=A0A369KFV6_9BACT|nr:UPF0158 family protein [Candidatus Similichlamydia laticola]RDB31787.1 hypothetical protein HAT2_00167 [Candidatus Similichlamydia laticola]
MTNPETKKKKAPKKKEETQPPQSDFPEAQNPLILRFNRLMDAFAKSDDERDYFLDRVEGFIIYMDLDKDQEEIEALLLELQKPSKRYYLIPKLTFYEQKKLMEGFIHEKVYDIDTREKLLDILGSRDPRENFLEFLLDHHAEHEKWQQYYQDKFRIRITEWLRENGFNFVFEEDLDLSNTVIEKIKRHLFNAKAPKDLNEVRQALRAKAQVYYSSEALNPRPKRGRPPKQIVKVEVEKPASADIYSTLPPAICSFLYVPEFNTASEVTFSAKFGSQDEFVTNFKSTQKTQSSLSQLEELSRRLANIRLTNQQDEIILGAQGRVLETVPEVAAPVKRRSSKSKG